MQRLHRILYLLAAFLLIGLAIVHLRTAHRQAIYQMRCLKEQEDSIKQQLWQQQLQLNGMLQSPGRIQEQIEKFRLSLRKPGENNPDE